jgi:cation diffusion facilitator family transporter
MLSEGVHSLVDTVNELLLLHGMRRAALPPDPDHPLGHGRELYFWSFIVALLVFAVGAGVSFYEGIIHILDPQPVESLTLTLGVLVLAAVFEGGSWWFAWREFHRRQAGFGLLEAARRSKDPATFTVLFEDSAALIGIVIAAGGILASVAFDRPELDGVASLGIGALLAATAAFLAVESKALLIGEAAAGMLRDAILAIAREDRDVASVNGVLTVHLAPEQVVVALSLEFVDTAAAPEIEACVVRLEARLKAEHPQIFALFVKPETAATRARRIAAMTAP